MKKIRLEIEKENEHSNIFTTVNLEMNTNTNTDPIQSGIAGINVGYVDIDYSASHDTQSTHAIDNTPSFESVLPKIQKIQRMKKK